MATLSTPASNHGNLPGGALCGNTNGQQMKDPAVGTDYIDSYYCLKDCEHSGHTRALCLSPCCERIHAILFPPIPSPAAHLIPGNRNEGSPLQHQEMESSSTAGAHTQPAPPLPENPYTNPESSGMTLEHNLTSQPTAEEGEMMLKPSPTRYLELVQAKIAEANADQQNSHINQQITHGPEDAAAQVLNGMIFGVHVNIPPLDDLPPNGALQNEASTSVNYEEEADSENAKAYAKLVFTDGDFFITTHDVVLGRNMERFEQIKRRKKQELRAREELDTYRKEPSQPSQHGDGDPQNDASNSSQSLEGRPAPPSNFSEHGGPVWYPPEDEGELHRPRSRRRISHFSKSSSTTSVAPANLHAGMLSDMSDPYREPAKRTNAFIPIHTQIPEDIGKISKEHLMFSYNFELEQWELKVVGNRAFINDEIFEKGSVIPLQHNDEIMIATISMVFKLPDNFRHSPGLSRGTFSRHSEEPMSEEESDEDDLASTTSGRRVSTAVELVDSESDEDEEAKEELRVGRKQPKLKLSTKAASKKPAKSNEKAGKQPKQQTKGKSSPGSSPQALKKPEKEKKPKVASKDDTEIAEESKDSPPSAPFIKPGSVLEGIPMEELPEKRKGPGRPPKEGNVSKRDTQLANKKRKEFEKRGEEPPPFKVLVDMVRRESKMKEMQAKMEANGQLEPGQQIMPSIEVDAGEGSSSMAGKNRLDGGAAGDSKKASSPTAKPKRVAMSPVKPESECTAEELKKPDHTYVYIIDQILSEHPLGTADLQEIYELIMKKYPYYKYRQSTMGWQSSVRHNLLQSPRFTDVGKSGKGKLWTIDHNSPLEKEKKRRGTPPKHGPGPVAGGQFGQHGGPAPYGNVYGQQQPNGQMPMTGQPGPSGSYYSPYAQQAAQHPQSGYMHRGQQSMAYPHGQAPTYHQQQPNGANPPPVRTAWENLIFEIVQFNSRHLAQFAQASPQENERQAEIVKLTTEFLSECYGDKTPPAATWARVVELDAQMTFGAMAEIFRRHKPDIAILDPWKVARPTETGEQSTADAGSAATGGEGGDNAGTQATTLPDEPPSGTKRTFEEDEDQVGPEAKRVKEDE